MHGEDVTMQEKTRDDSVSGKFQEDGDFGLFCPPVQPGTGYSACTQQALNSVDGVPQSTDAGWLPPPALLGTEC